MRRPLTHWEDDHQRALVRWADTRPDVAPYLYAIPNGGGRGRVEAARLVGLGVRKGIPDLCLCIARGGHFGLYLEIKRPAVKELGVQKGRVSAEQARVHDQLRGQNYRVVVVYGFEEGKTEIETYMASSPTRVICADEPAVNIPALRG